MTAWGSLRHKFFYFFNSGTEGLSPVIGSLLSLLIVFVLVGAVASSINLSGGRTNFQQPMARIALESCEGGIYGSESPETVKFEENHIVLMHEGGDPLPLDSVSIRISGYGKSYSPVFGPGSLTGDISVFYMDLDFGGKNPKYYPKHNRDTLEDGLWDVGERLVLCGQDSAVGSAESSVKVSVNGDDNTSDNYGFKAGSEITLMVIDRKGRNVLAERTAIVKLAD